jgi:protein arginine kinase activator
MVYLEQEKKSMLCQRCHKKVASVRYAEVVDGKVTEQHLCHDCMAAQQADNTGFELAGPVSVKRSGSEGDTCAVREAAQHQRSCADCGTRLSTVTGTGETGCPKCYESFGSHIEGILEGLQISMQHKGKTPHLDDARARVRTELQSKRNLLRSAVKTENYETAAHLRDEIRTLEKGLLHEDSGED